MSLPQGVNFRATAGFVTDGASTTYDIGTAVNYPTVSPQGNNIGWESISGGNGAPQVVVRDRNSGIDARLAGTSSTFFFGDVLTYRIDLPTAGPKNVRIAAGDANYIQVPKVDLFDRTVGLGNLCNKTTSGAAKWCDATNVERTSAADWVANNVAKLVNFTTTILRFQLTTAAVGASGVINHFWVEDAPGISIAWLTM